MKNSKKNFHQDTKSFISKKYVKLIENSNCFFKDVERLISLLPNIVEEYKVPFPKFNHLDFLWAIDAPQLLYNRLLEVMKMETMLRN